MVDSEFGKKGKGSKPEQNAQNSSNVRVSQKAKTAGKFPAKPTEQVKSSQLTAPGKPLLTVKGAESLTPEADFDPRPSFEQVSTAADIPEGLSALLQASEVIA